MNIAYFLLPKNRVAYLYDDYTFRQGLEKMRHHGYTAIPVITRSGQYLGTVSEGDFLWRLLDRESRCPAPRLHEGSGAAPRPGSHPGPQLPLRPHHCQHGGAGQQRHEQNFIPVVDDSGSFIGIVTRKDIIRYFAEQKDTAQPLRKIV